MYKQVFKNKRIIYDICLNILATAIPIAVLQLAIYPYIAKTIGSEEYGLMLTIYSVWIMISNSLGNVLNNVKLLRNGEYVDANIEGDFLLIFRRWSILNAVAICIIIWFYLGDFSIHHILLGTLASSLILAKAYLEVGFRIKLNYNAMLINGILLGTGFGLGLILFKVSGVWEFVFIGGYLLCAIFCAIKSKLLREKIEKTPKYKTTIKESYSLVISSLIGNLMNYADKLVLYPIMGGTAVSIYYTATIIGKITGMLTGPINSVILSYISKWGSDKRNVMKYVLIVGVCVAALGYVITIVIARPVIGFLFPQLVDEVMVYVPVTTITVVIGVLSSIVSPFVLKFSPLKWQIAISGIGSAIYFGSALILWKIYGLMGFCVGTAIGAISKLTIMLIIYYTKPVEEKSNI